MCPCVCISVNHPQPPPTRRPTQRHSPTAPCRGRTDAAHRHTVFAPRACCRCIHRHTHTHRHANREKKKVRTRITHDNNAQGNGLEHKQRTKVRRRVFSPTPKTCGGCEHAQPQTAPPNGDSVTANGMSMYVCRVRVRQCVRASVHSLVMWSLLHTAARGRAARRDCNRLSRVGGRQCTYVHIYIQTHAQAQVST